MSQLFFRAEIVLNEATGITADQRNHAIIWSQADSAHREPTYQIVASASVETKYHVGVELFSHVVVFSGHQLLSQKDAGLWRRSVLSRVECVKKVYGVTGPVDVFFSTGFSESV